MLNWTRFIQITLLGQLFVMGAMLGPTPAIADNLSQDDPPPNTRGRSAGSRGCSLQTTAADAPAEIQTMPAIILLAPSGLGKTISTRPAFAWFNRDSGANTPVVFRLYAYNTVDQTYQRLAETRNETAQAGIVAFALPEETANLEVGQRYLWQIELVCDRNRPSGNLFAEAEFEVIAPSPALTQTLSTAMSDADKAAIFTTQDLWYDALGITLTPYSPADEAMNTLRSRLFSQVTETEIEQTQLEESAVYWVESEAWEEEGGG
ncbi:MAG: DUF928 domain-containing protein [Cyanobacteria bacterium P01_G01_bin.38]